MYSLLVPFETSDSHKVKPTTPIAFGRWTARAGESRGQHYLAFDGFESPEEAESLLGRLEVALLFAAVKMKQPLSASFELGRIQRFEKPVTLGIAGGEILLSGNINFDPHLPVIYLTGEDPKVLKMSGELLVFSPGEPLLENLRLGIGDWQTPAITVDPKLRLAIEMYVSHFREVSSNAKFLTLVNALEVLCEPGLRKRPVQEVMAAWQAQIDARLESLLPNSPPEEREIWQALKDDLDFRKRESISSTLRQMVRQTLRDDPAVEELVNSARVIYSARSKLVHSGIVPSKPGFDTYGAALDLVQRVLLAKLTSRAGAEPSPAT